MTTTLFYSPGSSAPAPHIVLEEIGAPYTATPVAYARARGSA